MDDILWDLDDDPDGNVNHCLEHGVTVDEVEEILQNGRNETIFNERHETWNTFGYTSAGRHLLVAWTVVHDDPRTIYPVTAYETPERQRVSKRKRKRQ
jgi:hypothetical protein